MCWGVGALFDNVDGIESRVPPLMGIVGWVWFYRLIVDPAGKWERYIIGNPRFVTRIIRQKLGI